MNAGRCVGCGAPTPKRYRRRRSLLRVRLCEECEERVRGWAVTPPAEPGRSSVATMAELPGHVRRQLDALPDKVIAEYLAYRIGLHRGQLRLQVKDGRYESIRCVVTPDALK